MPRRCCIIGGGMLGLTLAHRLNQKGCAVAVYEAAPVLGGLASVWELGDLVWDRHYHVILASDSSLRGLLRDLGLETQISWVATKTGFFSGGQLHPFTSIGDFLRFPGLTGVDKVRLLTTILLNARRRDATALEQILVSDYLRRLSGESVFQRFWLPLLKSKLGDNYRLASASFIWATIRRLTAARRAGIQERFGYVNGGYRTIVTRLSGALTDAGVELFPGRPVGQVTSQPSGVSVRLCDGSSRSFDQVVLTTPGPVAVDQCGALTDAERNRWSAIRYQGIICASLLMKQPLAPYYLTNICDERVPFTGVVEMSTLIPPVEFGNRSLVYLPKYVDPAHPMFEWSDDRIKEDFLRALKLMYGSFDESSLEAFRISRVRHVFPVPTLGYSANLPPMKTSVPGVHIINSAHIVNGTLNVNEVVQLADRASSQVAA